MSMRTPHHILRRSLACALAAALAAQSQGAHAQEAAPAEPIPEASGTSQRPDPSLTPAERMAAGKVLYAQRKYVEAARIYESVDTANALYNAAMSRAAAGHDAHALLLWIRYLEVAPDDERAEVQESIDTARRLTVEVQFARSADAAGPRTLVLQAAQHLSADELRVAWPEGQATLRVSLDPGQWSAALEGAKDGPRSLRVHVERGEPLVFDLAPELPLSPVRLRLNPARALRRGVTVTWTGPGEVAERRVTTPESSQWKLPPGRWQLAASAPGYDPTERTVEVAAKPVELAMELKRDRESRTRLGMGVGLGVAALGLMAGGGVLLGQVVQSLKPFPEDSDVLLLPDEMREVQRLKRRTLAGNLLLSAGAGTAVVALTSGLTRGKKILAVETGLGAGLAVVGSMWLVMRVSTDPYLDLDKPTRGELDGAIRDIRVAGLLLGAGLGLMVPAVVALISRRSKGRARQVVSVNASMGMRGVTIQGAF